MNEDKLSRLKETMMKYAPSCLSVNGIATMLEANRVAARRYAALSEVYESTHAKFARYKLRVIQSTHSNNWLKMHGYPMRRRKPN